MKTILKQSSKAKAFSIVELLTVMSIIVILFSLLMPALALARRYAKRVQQHAQFRSISAGLALFSKPASEGGYGELPDSRPLDDTGEIYCGAQKLAEALVGQDLLGFNPKSLFLANGLNPAGLIPEEQDLYTRQGSLMGKQVPVYPQWYIDNLRSRKLNLDIDGANVNTLYGIYGNLPAGFGNLGDPGDPNGGIVLCDVYGRVKNIITGRRTSRTASRRSSVRLSGDCAEGLGLWMAPKGQDSSHSRQLLHLSGVILTCFLERRDIQSRRTPSGQRKRQ